MQSIPQSRWFPVLDRRQLLAIGGGWFFLHGVLAADAAPPAAKRLNELGLENQALAGRVGRWDVTETVWDKPGAAPVSTTGLVAERRMVGSMLQEFLHPASAVSGASVKRIDYLTFNRVEGRWEYVSMDMRDPVGIMSASSFGRDKTERIHLTFQPFAVAGNGVNVTGQMLRMDQFITRQGPKRDTKEQYFILADGVGTRWLAIRYTYVRQS